MQNWNTMQAPVNYEQHANWYNNMYNGTTGIKTEPGTVSPPTGMTSPLETYLKQHAQQQQQQHQLPPRDTISMMTPSPSNNDSMQQHYFEGNMQQQFLQQHQQYQQQFQQAQQAAAHNQVTAAQLSLGFKPLTPPGLPAAMLPSMASFFPANSQANLHMTPKTPNTKPNVLTPASETTEKIQTVITPRNTPPIDITPPKSPQPTPRKCKKPNDDDEVCNNNNPTTNTNSNSQRNSKLPAKDDDNSDTDDGQSESGVVISNVEQLRSMYGEEIIDWDQIQDDITRPIINSHGKMKKFSCRTCNFTAFTKLEFWLHSRTHMKSEKILKCPLCPFVTELKHHLEYHICKHENVKPFQCHLCTYSCVNKSMLASHLKSHSPVYQYNCGECDYFTKYCHSFKLHLRKMQHKQGVILNEEGQPDPSIVIDVYGTRRGPKSKTTKRTRNDSQSSGTNGTTTSQDVPTQSLPNNLQNYSIIPAQQLPPSPARSNSSDMPPVTIAQQQQQQSKEQKIDATNILIPIQKQCEHALPGVLSNLLSSEQSQQPISNLLAPLASLLQNNHNISLLPYLNLNLQMLAAQQQAAAYTQEMDKEDAQSTREDADDQDEHIDDSSYDSAMDLTQNSPLRVIKNESMEEVALNLKLQEESNDSTPLASSNTAARRKGRALQLDALLHSKLVTDASNQIVEQTSSIDMTVSATSKDESSDKQSANNEQSDKNDGQHTNTNNNANNSENTNSSTSNLSEKTSNMSSNSNGSKITQETPTLPAGLYECKYCEMYYKNAVIHTIHMGYHSCDDVFKCNMCGVKCDGPVDFFVHIARTAHS